MNRRTLLTSLLSGLSAGVSAIAGRKKPELPEWQKGFPIADLNGSLSNRLVGCGDLKIKVTPINESVICRDSPGWGALGRYMDLIGKHPRLNEQFMNVYPWYDCSTYTKACVNGDTMRSDCCLFLQYAGEDMGLQEASDLRLIKVQGKLALSWDFNGVPKYAILKLSPSEIV